MKYIIDDNKLTDEELDTVKTKYKFNIDDYKVVDEAYIKVQEYLDTVMYYQLYSSEECQFANIPYDFFVIGIITLGEGVDELQDIYDENEEILHQYAVDCISMELLKKAYSYFDKTIFMKFNKHVGSYDFLGDKFSIKMTSDVLRILKPEKIKCNDAFMLTPKKTATFIAKLYDEIPDNKCSICKNCTNLKCPNRKIEINSSENIIIERNKLRSYGYKRIFNKK